MKNQEIVDYIMSVIDRYKNGDVTKEIFYEIIHTFVSDIDLEYSENESLKYVLEHLIPDACLFYIQEPGEWQEKENGFRQAILECEEILKDAIKAR